MLITFHSKLMKQLNLFRTPESPDFDLAGLQHSCGVGTLAIQASQTLRFHSEKREGTPTRETKRFTLCCLPFDERFLRALYQIGNAAESGVAALADTDSAFPFCPEMFGQRPRGGGGSWGVGKCCREALLPPSNVYLSRQRPIMVL